MKFKGLGNTIVWDRKQEKELCRFENGQFESEDPRTCEILANLGYEHTGDLPEKEKVVDEALEALKVRAKELKINNWHTMKAETLTEKIIEAEKEAAKNEHPKDDGNTGK